MSKQQTAMIEELTVSWVNENTNKIQAMAELRKLTESEKQDLIARFIREQAK
jgi:hypothetical protein